MNGYQEEAGLGPDHLGEVFAATQSAHTKWYNIGLQLDIPTHILDGIQADCQNTSDRHRDMLKEWLKGGSAHWQSLEAALENSTVRESGLAGQLRRKYSSQISDQSDASPFVSANSSLSSLAPSLPTTLATSSLASSHLTPTTSSLVTEPSTHDIIPYGCGCGRCTFASYIDGGCPDPKPSTTSFPFLHTPCLTEAERKQLLGRLYDEYEQINFKFSHLTKAICDSLDRRQVAPKKLVRSLRDLKAFQPPSQNDLPLLQDRMKELIAATDIDDVFFILSDYTSFFSFQLIEHIVVEHGDAGDRTDLDTYKRHFMDFCRRNIFECPVYATLRRDQATLVFKIENEVVERGNMKHLQQLTTRISRALALSQHTLLLCSVEEGCVQLAYQLPASVAECLFPLSDEQQAELREEGVAKLACKNWFYSWKAQERPLLGFTKEVFPPSLTDRDTLSHPPDTREEGAPSGSGSSGSVTTQESFTVIAEADILDRHSWYHGNITRQEAEDRLTKLKENSFLFRRKEGVGLYALSESYNGVYKHYIVKKSNGVYESLYQIEHRTFHTIPEMVDYLQEKFFFKPCHRTTSPSETTQLLKEDWMVTTPTGAETDLNDCTGESGYGTGETMEGFPPPLKPRRGSAAAGKSPADKETPYTPLRREGMNPDPPYSRVNEGTPHPQDETVGHAHPQDETVGHAHPT